MPFAFKDLMIRIILQFTLRIAFRCVLHRCRNQEIHRLEVVDISLRVTPRREHARVTFEVVGLVGLKNHPVEPSGAGRHYSKPCEKPSRAKPLGQSAAILRGWENRHPIEFSVCIERKTGRSQSNSQVVVILVFMSMILPQVHLRKPCYDFSFL